MRTEAKKIIIAPKRVISGKIKNNTKDIKNPQAMCVFGSILFLTD
jgi:hypothetical protein